MSSELGSNESYKPKKRRRGCTCLVVAFVVFLVLILAGGAAVWFVGDYFTRNYLDISLMDTLSIRGDLRRNYNFDDSNSFSDNDRAAFENHITQQLFLNPDVNLPYDLLFDALFDFLLGNNSGNGGGFLPFGEDLNETVDDNSFMAIFSSLLIKDNINTVALADYSPLVPHVFDLTGPQLGAFLNEFINRGLASVRIDANEDILFLIALLDELSLAQVLFIGTADAPVMQIIVRTGLRQIARDILADTPIPNFITNFLTRTLLPQYAYISAFVGLSEDNAGLTMQVNNLNEAQMMRLYRLIDGVIDFASTGLNVENRNADLNFEPSNLAAAISEETGEFLSPVMARLAPHLIFDNITAGRISSDLFGSLIALIRINYDYYGVLRYDALEASDFILALRFFIISETEAPNNPASANYNNIIDEFTDKLFLTDYGRENFSALLRATDMLNFNPAQFNIRDGANSIAHDTRCVDELFIFINDADFGAILRDRFLGNLLTDVPLSLIALHSIPDFDNSIDLSSLQTGEIKASRYGVMIITFKVDLAQILYDLEIPFLSELLIDALYIDLEFEISAQGLRHKPEENGEGYFYYYSTSVFVNGKSPDHIEIVSILRLVEFFSGMTVDVDEITRQAGRELYRFFDDMRGSWFDNNINFAVLSLGEGEYQTIKTGIVISSIFHLLAAAANPYLELCPDILQSAVQGMFGYEPSFSNSRNFKREDLVVRPINGDFLNIAQSILLGNAITDYKMGLLLSLPYIAQEFGSNPFVGENFDLVQLKSLAECANYARLYFTFRLDVYASTYLLPGDAGGLGEFMPSELYFTFVISWARLGHSDGNLYNITYYDTNRIFKINTLSAGEQQHLFGLTDYCYLELIDGPINDSLDFLNIGHFGTIIYDNGTALIPTLPWL